jgi:hypothetical protein
MSANDHRAGSILHHNPRYFSRFLDTNGDGTGTKNSAVDHSSSEGIYYIQPGTGEIYNLYRMIITIRDAAKLVEGKYGNSLDNTAGNGIQVRVQDDDGTIIDLTDGVTIKQNEDWSMFCHDTTVDSSVAGKKTGTARWTFTRGGTFIALDGNKNERLEVVLNDNFSSLTYHYACAQGHIERE